MCRWVRSGTLDQRALSFKTLIRCLQKSAAFEQFLPGLSEILSEKEEMMALTLYFLRHGQMALSREDVFCGSYAKGAG